MRGNLMSLVGQVGFRLRSHRWRLQGEATLTGYGAVAFIPVKGSEEREANPVQLLIRIDNKRQEKCN